jgi:transcriptional regulator with XRE-family HTH domain
MKIGEKVKNLRLAQDLTQEDLADRADLTKGFISMLERDLTSPSLDTLELILNALDTSLAEFFEDEEAANVVFPKDKRVVIDNENGTITEVPIAGAQGREMDMIIVTLSPGSATPKERSHNGDECGLVLEGSVWIVAGRETYKAEKGDAFYYEANKQHWLENRSTKEAKILWISSPPSF